MNETPGVGVTWLGGIKLKQVPRCNMVLNLSNYACHKFLLAHHISDEINTKLFAVAVEGNPVSAVHSQPASATIVELTSYAFDLWNELRRRRVD